MLTHIASLVAAAAAHISECRRSANEAGGSLLEYALIMGLVSVAAFGALTLLGNVTSQSLGTSAGSITS